MAPPKKPAAKKPAKKAAPKSSASHWAVGKDGRLTRTAAGKAYVKSEQRIADAVRNARSIGPDLAAQQKAMDDAYQSQHNRKKK